ncbi:MAG TPA: aminotransferase class I/II-fold pyridoxal phosphate-dependent enzyme [Candidatus Binataceae bacterium]|nr:aminotransferase class I/II-fold pyridoxal phosphate-dependent enzyme [Candidatus Binataceae bacterium]
MSIIPIDRRHGGNPPPDTLDFSASINPLGPPASAIAAYHAAAAQISAYPPARSERLERALARWLGVEPANVLAGSGTTQLIYLLARTLGLARAAVAIPTFSEFANALASAGVSAAPIRLDARRGYALDIAELNAALDTGVSAIFVGRPNSPTGSMLSTTAAREIAERCARRGAICVLDEAFIDFATDAESSAPLAASRPGLFVLRSLTKSFAIAGLRLGCVVGAAPAIAKLAESIEPWSVNVAAEAAGLACIAEAPEFLSRTREVIASERDFLVRALDAIDGIHVFPSAANFLMLHVSDEPAPGAFAAQMLRGAIAIRDLASMPGAGPGLYRIGIRLRADNQRLIAVAARWRGARVAGG